MSPLLEVSVPASGRAIAGYQQSGGDAARSLRAAPRAREAFSPVLDPLRLGTDWDFAFFHTGGTLHRGEIFSHEWGPAVFHTVHPNFFDQGRAARNPAHAPTSAYTPKAAPFFAPRTAVFSPVLADFLQRHTVQALPCPNINHAFPLAMAAIDHKPCRACVWLKSQHLPMSAYRAGNEHARRR